MKKELAATCFRNWHFRGNLSCENCRKRLAAKFGIGKSRLLLSQGKDGRNLLEDDVQLESLLEDELKLATAGNISKIKIEINYLKGFDHPHIMKILEDIVFDPNWGFPTTSFNMSK